MAKAKEEQEEEAKLTDIPGIGPGIATKLEAAGVYDLMGLAVMSPSDLAELAGVGVAVARKAIQAARGMMNLGFTDGAEFDKKRQDVGFITTGSENLNALLGGKGVESKSITETYGAFGSGKCISKDTLVSYFNDTRMHVQTIEETYEKYKQKADEEKFEEGFAVPVSSVKVLAWDKGKLKVSRASHLYKEKVKKLALIKTKRGRIIKATGQHQVLSFDKGIAWKKSGMLREGDLIASPKELNLVSEKEYDEEDAYFLGLFAAEGTANPFSISTGSKKLKDWLCSYIERKFGYAPTVREDTRKGKVFIVLLRDKTRFMMDGLDKTNSSSKFIPEAVFLSHKKVILSFLGGYFDGDAEVSYKDISVTTKSKVLASQLTYLLLRLGVSATIKNRYVKDRKYYVVRISGEDREKLFDVGFKIKKFRSSLKNSSYGYPREIVSFIQELYKKSIGGNRGNLRKRVGKYEDSTAYRNLVGSSMAHVINSPTIENIRNIFIGERDHFITIIKLLEGKEFTLELLKKVYADLPFAFNGLARDMGVKKSSIRNYYSRNIPESKLELLRNLIVNELKTRVDYACLALEVISEIKMFNWDVVESVEVIDYDDYVYDFVVPEGHSFVGGNLPTMMHNTQLGLTLAVNVQLPKEQGGANGKAVYIDTEGTFRPDRIRQIAEGIGANGDKVLKNILVARAFNSDHQILLLDKVTELIKDGEPIKLMVIDSLTAHFRAEFSGRGQLADRQQRLNRYLHQLMKLAEQHNIAVFVTNQVMSNPAMMFGDPTTAIGGNIVGHACLKGDSLIQLADGGIVEIKDMKEGKNVLSGDFDKLGMESSENDKVFVNPDVKEVYHIKTNCQIDCSALHRFFGVENFDIVEKEAKDLREGDFVAQAGKIDIVGEERVIPRFKVKRVGKISKKDGESVSEKLKEDGVKRDEICRKIGITPRQFRRVLHQEYPTSFEVLDNLQSYFGGQQVMQVVPVFSNKHRNLEIPAVLSPALGQIFGYFIGDGNLEERGLRFRDERFEVLTFYKKLFKQVFNIDAGISKVKDKNCYTLYVNSKEIRDLFVLMLPGILEEVGRSKKEVVGAFARGFFDAEGHVNKKRAYVSVSQKERRILKYLQLFLLRFGVRSTIKFDIGKKNMHVLRIIDKDVKGYLQIGFSARDKQRILAEKVRGLENTYSYEMMPVRRRELRNLLEACGLKFSKIMRSRPLDYAWVSRKELERAHASLMNCRVKDRQIKQKIDFIFKLLHSDLRFERIRKIDVSKNKGELLYDFSVPKHESYVANGFVVHNSTYRIYLRRGKQGSRVAKMIDSPNLPDNEAQFYVTEAGVRDEG